MTHSIHPILKPVLTVLATLAFTATISASSGAQITLAEALARADRSAFGNRIAAGNAAEATARAIAPLKGVLPGIRFEAGYIRTTDPIGAFGSTLRQRTFTQADFDPSRLNFPAATPNYQGGIVLDLPILNADAWLGRRAAVRAAAASDASQDWTRLSVRVDVVRAYYGAVLAAERAAMLRSAARAALAHQTQAEAMVRQGLATRSDALLAAVRAGNMEADLAEAVGGATNARRQLALLLGDNGETLQSIIEAPATLPSAERIRSVVSADTVSIAPENRADVVAANSGLAAARADFLRARSTYLPRINSFARYDWNSADRLYGGMKNWTAGIMASWSPFGSAGELSDLRAAAARQAAARAQADAAQSSSRLDAAQTRTSLTVALARLSIAERAVAQGAEAHRIVARKYEGGLATVVELLDAQAAETQSALAFVQARYAVIVSAAERRRAVGNDPALLAVLDDSSMVTTTLLQ